MDDRLSVDLITHVGPVAVGTKAAVTGAWGLPIPPRDTRLGDQGLRLLGRGGPFATLMPRRRRGPISHVSSAPGPGQHDGGIRTSMNPEQRASRPPRLEPRSHTGGCL